MGYRHAFVPLWFLICRPLTPSTTCVWSSRPTGANIKIKYDEDLGCFSLSRILPLGVTYPYDFGFVPQTLAQDGDPLDVMVLIDALTYPGVVISCRLLGALHVEERGLRGRPNHRFVAVPVKAARKDELRNFPTWDDGCSRSWSASL